MSDELLLCYVYKAKLVRVIDGDIIDVDIDLGFHMTTRQRLRLAEIDTLKLMSRNPNERIAARQAKTFILKELSGDVLDLPDLLDSREGWRAYLQVQTSKSDSFGRYLAIVWYRWNLDDEWTNLNEELLDRGFAKPYKKKRKKGAK